MRARGLLKGNPAPSLCIFCASRLLGDIQPIITVPNRQRRLLNTTRPPRQSAATAAQPTPPNGSPAPAPSRGWNPDGLTATERAEKERRRQQQLAMNREQASNPNIETVQQKEQRLRAQRDRGSPNARQPSRTPAQARPLQISRDSYRFRPDSHAAPSANPTQSTNISYGRQSGNAPEFQQRPSMLERPDSSRARPSTTEPEPMGDWKHLSRRNENAQATAKPPSPSPPTPEPTSFNFRPIFESQSSATIDRAFEEHQRSRRSSSVPEFRRDNRSLASDPLLNLAGNRSAMRCGRCLEYGHAARDCTGPVRATCNVCGQTGHLRRDCPQVQSPFGGKSERTEASSVRRFNIGSREPAASVQPLEIGRQTTSSASQWSERFDPTIERSEPAEPVVDKYSPEAVDTPQDREQARRAARSRRGFDDDEEDAVVSRRNDRRSGRSSRRTTSARYDEEDDEAAAAREVKAARKAARRAEREAEKREAAATVSLPDFITVSRLAQTLNVHYDPFIARLQQLGYDDIFPGKVLNAEISGMIAMEYNFEPVFDEHNERLEEEERDLKPRAEVEDRSSLPARPPVVTIMGHVDHGKTTILDYLRKSSVAAGEAGGITQHIGAFSVPISGGDKSITFLDTPGHAAFLAMRQRGANVTDIVILVVAADDSVKPQTIESIRCAREARVPILVAINKIDKEEADVQKVKQDLARNGVEIEDFGGDTQVVCVSGKTGKGMEDLEEAAITLSEILDHRAETDGDVEGWLLEATTKKAGRVATVLVKRGTLRPGMVIVAGKTWARVRTLKNEAGQLVEEATPGMPIEVDGWRDDPFAGDQVLQAPSEHKATDVVDYRIEKAERTRTAEEMEIINEARRIDRDRQEKEKAEARVRKEARNAGIILPKEEEKPDLDEEKESGQISVPFIIKADVSGSAEAVAAYIPSLTSPLITPNILYSGVGAVHESDIEFAATAQGHIIAFNLPPNSEAKGAAEAQGVKILENNVIYRVLDDVKAVLEDKLPPLITQRVLGEADIGAAFDIKIGGRKVMWIAGCRIRNGVVARGARVRVMRGSEKVYDGTVTSLKNVKKDVQEMRKGTECGMGFEGWEGFQIGDVVQTYEEISSKRTL